MQRFTTNTHLKFHRRDEMGNLDEEEEWKMRMGPFMHCEVKLYQFNR